VTTLAFFITDFWNDQIVAHDRQWMFLLIAGVLISFGFIRLSTRLMRSPKVPWWPGSVVSEGGVHVHHLVFGIVLMMIAGSLSFAAFANSPWYEIFAFLFGVGIGLTIDEFALWVYLDDVYWAKQGRSSIDAAVIAVALMGLVLLGVRPFDIDADSSADVIVSVIGALVVLGLVVICIAKQRFLHGVVGLFFFPLAAWGAARLGKPGSLWARRFYGDRMPSKQQRAEARFAADRRTERFKEGFRDVVGGSTEEIYVAKIERHVVNTEQAE
jgi:hypothetical protein